MVAILCPGEKVNPSSAGSVYVGELNVVITVTADVLGGISKTLTSS